MTNSKLYFLYRTVWSRNTCCNLHVDRTHLLLLLCFRSAVFVFCIILFCFLLPVICVRLSSAGNMTDMNKHVTEFCRYLPVIKNDYDKFLVRLCSLHSPDIWFFFTHSPAYKFHKIKWVGTDTYSIAYWQEFDDIQTNFSREERNYIEISINEENAPNTHKTNCAHSDTISHCYGTQTCYVFRFNTLKTFCWPSAVWANQCTNYI